MILLLCEEEVADETGCVRAIGSLNQYNQVKLNFKKYLTWK